MDSISQAEQDVNPCFRYPLMPQTFSIAFSPVNPQSCHFFLLSTSFGRITIISHSKKFSNLLVFSTIHNLSFPFKLLLPEHTHKQKNGKAMSNKFFLEMLSEYLFLKLDFKKELCQFKKAIFKCNLF